MKRVLLLLGFPVVLLALWGMGATSGAETSAQVDITTDEVLPLRGAVIARLATIGGVRVSEHTEYAGAGASELTFRVPAARLEEALVELGQVGGTVTAQEIDLQETTDAADGVTRRLSDLEGCLDDVSRSGAQPAVIAQELAGCRARLADVSSSLEVATPRLEDATLAVRIEPASNSNAVLVAGVAMLAVALAVMAFLTLRSAREDRMVDMSDRIDLSDHDDDLHLGRRWN